MHLVWWLEEPSNYTVLTLNGTWVIDMAKYSGGVDTVARTHALIFHTASEPWPAPLHDMMRSQPEPEPVPQGRVREPPVAETPPVGDAILDEPRFRTPISGQSSEGFQSPRSAVSDEFQSLPSSVFTARRSPWVDPCAQEAFMLEDFVPFFKMFGDNVAEHCYKVERELRALNPEELKSHEAKVWAGILKELQSWLDNKVCRPVLISDFTQRTKLRPLPSRWVIEFKEKLGDVVVKCRLCVKGFAERRADELQTNSPTA